MKIGYARVSTAEQHEGRQIEWLRQENVGKVFLDKLSGKDTKRPQLQKIFDASTPTGKLLLTLVGGIAEFEREITLQRQREGIAIAKKAGKYKGRKPMAGVTACFA